MLTQKMRDALNEQVNKELYSAYLYLSMSAYYRSIDLPGFANWMRRQWEEELKHAYKMFDFVSDSGGRALLAEIEGPQQEWDGPLAPFEHAASHERKVTGLINALVDVAKGEGDDATLEFLQWYVREQDEEEESADKAVAMIEAAGDSKDALAGVDAEFARRV